MEPNKNDPYLRLWQNICQMHRQNLGYPVEESWFLFPAAGIGDQVLLLSLLPAFRQHHGGKITICADPRMESLIQLYRGYFDGLISVDGVNVWAFRPHMRFALGQPYVPWNAVHGEGRLYDFCLDHDISLADLTRHLLHLPRSAATAPPIVPDVVRGEAERRFRALGLVPGRTVILAPVANSIPARMPKEWWARLVQLLAEKGFTVAVNQRNAARGFDMITGADDGPIPGAIPFDCPLAETLPLADLAGYHLSARSGISEILAFSTAKGKILYPIGPSPSPGPDGLDWRISHLGAGGTVSIPRLYGRACEEINMLPQTTPDEVLKGWL
ncbi:MAG: glycosyltransferase family 9 protein [Alphaproteobacteria bacterium]|nr:glycosyltransferase family 9 protein [Alphaproteobacteria bacterium]